jgi:hypothetical protein
LLEEEEDALLSGRRPLATLLSPAEGGRSLRDRPAMDPNLHHIHYYYSALQLELLLHCRQSEPHLRAAAHLPCFSAPPVDPAEELAPA